MSFSVHLLFSIVFAVASSINHIDDTDETYGYYEPIHYLLYGTGMQTWEYSPEYAIRSYAFLAPFTAAAAAMQAVGLTRLQIFYGLRLLLSQFMAYALSTFAHESTKVFGPDRCRYLIAALVCCPGLFFCSSALLPSAVCCALVALAASSFMARQHGRTVLFGCFAVLWTGWPFVGLIFLPLGMLILYKEFRDSGMKGILSIATIGVLHLAAVSAAVLLIDSHYYGKRTFPPLNILLYNALSGNGDELYGIEPASYYIKNLLLTLGLSFPMALLEALAFCGDVVLAALSKQKDFNPAAMLAEFAVVMCAGLWLGVLISRPHKEERFLYPIYPLLCLLSALAFARIEAAFVFALSFVLPTENSGSRKRSPNDRVKSRGETVFINFYHFEVWMALGLMATARILALHNNFSGYIDAWKKVDDQVKKDFSTGGIFQDKTVSGKDSSSAVLCMGSDWYTFPSHFFLPSSVRYEYISDGFGGQLPQHFAKERGTSAAPLQPFNDQNREETSRYVELAECDYVMRTMQEDHRNLPKNAVFFDGATFTPHFYANIIDAQNSPMLTRVINFPGLERLSGATNAYHQYTLFHGGVSPDLN